MWLYIHVIALGLYCANPQARGCWSRHGSHVDMLGKSKRIFSCRRRVKWLFYILFYFLNLCFDSKSKKMQSSSVEYAICNLINAIFIDENMNFYIINEQECEILIDKKSLRLIRINFVIICDDLFILIDLKDFNLRLWKNKIINKLQLTFKIKWENKLGIIVIWNQSTNKPFLW